MPRLSKIGAACLAAFGWTSGTGVTNVTTSYLVVAGGAAGGNGGSGGGGGGGAGGYRTGTLSLNPTLSYTVVVGAGGVALNPAGGYGSDSTFSTITSNGGGGGTGATGNPGGSGGGGGGGGGAGISYAGGAGNTPSTSPSQGNNGGNNAAGGYLDWAGGGGGGASAVGQNAPGVNNAGAGGAGTASSISGTSVTYAGGGGGGTWNTGTSGGAGGAGGGGAGGKGAGSLGTNGTINLGAGGGGGGQDTNGGYGGSGIVIVSYAGAQQFGGGVVTTDGTNTIHTFNTSGTLSPITPLTASYLIVAGGGAGGGYLGGGGGAGGLLSGSGITIDTNSTYLVTVGAGAAGTSTTAGANGSNSAFSMVTTTAVGGGGGGSSPFVSGFGPADGATGGSGGGAGLGSGSGTTGGAGTSGQGFAGGSTTIYGGTANYSCSGGGGAGAVGGSGSGSSSTGVAGGVGVTSSISGTSTYYAGGGGSFGSVTPGAGGLGGGGTGGTNGGTPPGATDATANTGGGGGGAGQGSGYRTGGSGGSGVVIISYAGSTQLMAGGTVTITGGNVIHTFTSSGYLTPLTYVGNSLRFRSSATGYLKRTPTVTSSTLTKLTFSAWVKRGTLGAYQVLYGGDIPSGSTNDEVRFNSSDYLEFLTIGGSVGYLVSNAVYRDPAAWYHIVCTYDSTQATSTNRMQMWVNGVLVAGALSPVPAQNTNLTGWNNVGKVQTLGIDTGLNAFKFDGYMAEVRSIDGQALTPNSFGTFNSYGVWQPITYGGSYGTNGFYLPFNAGTGYSNQFNSTPSYLYLTSGQAAAPVGNSTWSIECWTNWIGTPGSNNWDLFTNSQSAGVQAVYIGAQSKWEIGAYGVADVLPATVITPQSDMVGRWNHLVFTSNGTQLRIFLNGVMIGYGASTYSFAASRSFQYIGTNAGTSIGTIVGYMSNLRVCLGSIPTTYQTSSTTINDRVFTSPTSDLTTTSQGATNVSLLTCQSSTFIDNSTNGFTITTDGSPTRNLLSPFGAQPFNDQGPSGNNWLPNNISSVLNSTLDEMTDVPTLTSATAANYAVLNPLNTPATPKFANLGFAGNGSDWYPIVATMGVSSGKFYWETIYNANFQYGMTGIAPSTYVPSVGSYPGATGSLGFGYWSVTGAKYNNGSSTAYGSSYTGGDVIGVALDMDAGTITFYKNNTSQGVAFTGLTGTYMPAFAAYVDCTVNFGQQPFTYTPPSGYLALNTYNL